MTTELRNMLWGRVGLVWSVLIAATAVSWIVGTNHGINARLATTLVLAVTFVKVSLVVQHFMEVREAVLPLRLAAYGYCVVIAAVLIVMYLAGS